MKEAGMKPPMSLVGLDHLVIRAHDPERLVDFYCTVLGCLVEKRQPEFGIVQLRAGRSLIDILDVASALGREKGAGPSRQGGSNMDHLCLRVEPFAGEDIRDHLRAHGCDPGEVVQRYGAEGNGPSIYFDDPEGNMIELKGPPSVI
jgi:catechol 2,3-dioxygenase-like lactoylglutathione lyase family enzyme